MIDKLRLHLIFILLMSCTLPSHTSAQQAARIDSVIQNQLQKYKKTNAQLKGRIGSNIEFNYDKSQGNFFFNYQLQGNLMASFMGFSTPLSFSYSNGKTAYGYNLNPVQLPSFNRFGISPKRGAFTGHIGYRQLMYSKYTLNGVQFKGYGAEYSPKGYYFSFMNGELKPAIAENSNEVSSLSPSFERNSWGLKFGKKTEDNELSVSFVKVDDNENSLENFENFQNQIRPRENAVVGVTFIQTLGKKIILESDYAFSALSEDIISDPFYDIGTQYTAYNYFGLFTTRENSLYDKAYNVSLKYKLENFDVGMRREQVDPKFRTLGANFYINNFITNTVNVNKSLLDNNLNLSTELGFEEKVEYLNNLNPKRLIGQVNSKWKVNEQWTISTGYSNMNNSEVVRRPSNISTALDSVLQSQTKERLKASITYAFGPQKESSIQLYGSAQRGLIVDLDNTATDRLNINRNVGINFTRNLEKVQTTLGYNFMHNRTDLSSLNAHTLSHSMNFALEQEQSLRATQSINLSNAINTSSLFYQGEISYNFDVAQRHKMQTSLSSQIGTSKTLDQDRNGLFAIIFKVTYDLSFSYQK